MIWIVQCLPREGKILTISLLSRWMLWLSDAYSANEKKKINTRPNKHSWGGRPHRQWLLGHTRVSLFYSIFLFLDNLERHPYFSRPQQAQFKLCNTLRRIDIEHLVALADALDSGLMMCACEVWWVDGCKTIDKMLHTYVKVCAR